MQKARILFVAILAVLVPAAFVAAEAPPILDLYPTGSLSAAAQTMPWGDDALSYSGFRGTLNLDGYAFDTLWVYMSVYGYTNLAGLANTISWNDEFFGPTVSYSVSGNELLLAILELQEAWVDFPVGAMDIRIGQQILAWGQADGNNPTDILNARRIGTRFTSSLDEQKISSPAVNLTYNLQNNLGTVQAVFLPISIAADLPSIAMNLTIPGATTTNITILDDENPEIAIENVEGGIRGLFYLGNISCSASYFTGLDRYPDFAVESTFVFPTLNITMTPEHNRIHQLGFDVVLLSGGWDIRTEWAGTLTGDLQGNDPAMKNSSISGVLQISRSFWDGRLTATGAWSPRIIVNYTAPEDYADPSDQMLAEQIRQYDGQAYPFENALTFRIAGKFKNETVQPEAMFLVETAARDWLATAAVNWNMADAWSLKLGSSFYGSFLAEGNSDRELGIFSSSDTIDDDNIYIELKYSF